MCEKCLLILILSTNIILTSTASPTEVSSNGKSSVSKRTFLLLFRHYRNKQQHQHQCETQHTVDTCNKHSLQQDSQPGSYSQIKTFQ